MPQIQPGNPIQPGEGGAPRIYGVDKVENAIPFQERLMRLFKPQEFVTVKNIDDEPLYWQYMPAENEIENFSEDGLQRQVTRENPEMWMIEPGATEVLVGASAYRALDTLYKNYASKTILKKFADPTQPQFNEKNEHLPKNFNFADGGAQEAFIKKAYLGKAMPSFQQQSDAQPVPAPAVVSGNGTLVQPEVAPMATDPNLPVPKTTEGAPLQAPQYADPDAKAVEAAKVLANAGSTTK